MNFITMAELQIRFLMIFYVKNHIFQLFFSTEILSLQ